MKTPISTCGLFNIDSPEKRKATPKGGLIVRVSQVKYMKLIEKFSGSPTWTRTRDLRINSPSLYRLSYQGIEEVRMIVILRWAVNLKFGFP